MNEETTGFSTGQRVRVVAGEFEGRVGTFLRPIAGGRAQIAVDIGPHMRIMHTIFLREIERLAPGGE
ncbi:MAG TPA: hypothetical protein VMW54_11795 [Terriglobia bacterium]|nr:hypothetical protein [Terriglobia bacterium]